MDFRTPFFEAQPMSTETNHLMVALHHAWQTLLIELLIAFNLIFTKEQEELCMPPESFIRIVDSVHLPSLKSTWHSLHILVHMDTLLTYFLVSVPSSLTCR